MPTGSAPICMECKNYRVKDTTKNSCNAFPKGIPDIVIFGGSDHKKSLPGDHGIQFEQKK